MKKYAVVKLFTLGDFDFNRIEFERATSKSLYSYEDKEYMLFLELYQLKNAILIDTNDEDLKKKIGCCDLNGPTVSEDDIFEAEDDESAKLIYEVWE